LQLHIKKWTISNTAFRVSIAEKVCRLLNRRQIKRFNLGDENVITTNCTVHTASEKYESTDLMAKINIPRITGYNIPTKVG